MHWTTMAVSGCTFPWGLSCEAWFETYAIIWNRLLALVLLIGVALAAVLGTQSGSRWALGGCRA
jgi:hypothetical protein